MKKIGVIISFAAPIQEVCIDGRDFLATAFQLFDPAKHTGLGDKTSVLESLFGPEIRALWESAVARSSQDIDYRLALHDLACAHPSLIVHHAKNRQPILGRYGTLFCSAFFVQSPIARERIIEVKIANPRDVPRPSVSLNDFLT